MKKLLMFLLVFVSLLGLSLSLVSSIKVNASTTGDVDLLICNPGEDSSTQMRFSFHTNVSGVVVQVAKKSDGNFDNAIVLTPECVSTDVAYPFKGTSWGINWGSSYDPATMKVCEADVSGLEPGTEYMYRVGATNFSETRYFTTAGTDGVWSFAVMADPQNYTAPLHSAINPNMNRAKANAEKLGMKLELVLCAGDQVEYGGVIDWWRALYDGVDLYKEMPLAMVVGNHDCLDGAGGKVTKGMYVTAGVWNAPRNSGNDDLFIEDLYWFKWNNVLFCMMNSEAVGTERFAYQDAWFREVCETVEHQYVVVMYHQGQWGTTTPSPNYWYNTFEEYGIDLSFSGDNHDYNRGGVMNVGPSRGQGAFPGHYVVVDDTRNASNGEKDKGGYCLVKVTPSCIYYYAYDQDDNLRDQAVFQAKRPFETPSTFDKAKFEKSIKIEVEEKDATKANLIWDGDDYVNNAKYLTILDEKDNAVKKYYLTSLLTKSIQISGLSPNTEYKYKVKIDYCDGSSNTIDATFTTSINYGKYSAIELKKLSSNHRLIFDPADIKAALLSSCDVYLNGTKVASYEPTAKFVAIDSSLISDEVEVVIKGIVKGSGLEVVIGEFSNKQDPTPPPVTKYTVTFKALDKVLSTQEVESGKAAIAPKVEIEGYNFKGWDKEFNNVTSDLVVNAILEEIVIEETKYVVRFLVDGVEVSRQEVKENEGAIAPADPVKEGYDFKGWDKDFSKITSNLDINAKFEKKEEVTPVDPTPVDPTPVDPTPIEPAPSGGCNKGTIVSLWSLILPLGVIVLFRRKRFY